jgi:hypothetical protein
VNLDDPLVATFTPGDPCTFDRTSAWGYGANESDVEVLSTVQEDPRVRQNVLNNTQTDVWTDWHVDIVNGKNLRAISVYKAGQIATPWLWEISTSPLGFFAHLVSTGLPNNPMAVNPGETLYIDFTYDVDVVPVSITQYPTTWYPIPEPSSILALLAGVGTLGLSALRRLKK